MEAGGKDLRGAGEVGRNGTTQLDVGKVGFKVSCFAPCTPAPGLWRVRPMVLCLPQVSAQMMVSVKDAEEIGCMEVAQG